MATAQPPASRTGRYWCAITYARSMRSSHERYPRFFDYGDAQAFRQGPERLRQQYNDAGATGAEK